MPDEIVDWHGKPELRRRLAEIEEYLGYLRDPPGGTRASMFERAEAIGMVGRKLSNEGEEMQRLARELASWALERDAGKQ